MATLADARMGNDSRVSRPEGCRRPSAAERLTGIKGTLAPPPPPLGIPA